MNLLLDGLLGLIDETDEIAPLNIRANDRIALSSLPRDRHHALDAFDAGDRRQRHSIAVGQRHLQRRKMGGIAGAADQQRRALDAFLHDAQAQPLDLRPQYLRDGVDIQAQPPRSETVDTHLKVLHAGIAGREHV